MHQRTDEQKWLPLDRPGLVQAGDKLRFRIGQNEYRERVKEVLNAGTDEEEILYDRQQNFYFITSMVVLGTSAHKDVEVLKSSPGKNGRVFSANFYRLRDPLRGRRRS